MLKRKIIKEVRSKEERLTLKSNRDTLDETQIILVECEEIDLKIEKMVDWIVVFA